MGPQKAHRASALKQSNKTHKTGRHKSKGALATVQKGKVQKQNCMSKNKRLLTKLDRKNQSQQLRKHAQELDALLRKKLGGLTGSPHLVAIVPLNESFDARRALTLFSGCDELNVVSTSKSGVFHIRSERFKTRYSFVLIPDGSTKFSFAELDLIKVCDTVLFLVSAASGPTIDDVGLSKIAAIKSQGLPTTIVACMDITGIHIKDQRAAHHTIQNKIREHFSDERVLGLDSSSDALNILRRIGTQKQRLVMHRDYRPHMLVEDAEFVSENDQTSGVLKVSGFLRGAPLNINGIIHISGYGDFHMKKIESSNMSSLNDASSGSIMLAVANPDLQPSLISENTPNPMDAEQTWPTAEELQEATELPNKGQKFVKKVPKGMSAYQAAWIPDLEECDSVNESDSEPDDEFINENMELDENGYSDDEAFQSCESEGETEEVDQYDKTVNFNTEAHDAELLKAARIDKQFPDEMDTPQDIAAKIRFQKYRGLESFRTSVWDKKENLPLDYARIFQFQNYDRTRRKMLKIANEGLVNPGSYVSITIVNVPSTIKIQLNNLQTHPLVIIGILPHEHKMSVVNVKLQQVVNYKQPLKSKERLLIQCGYRRFYAQPIFSEHTNGSRFKYERFFQHDSTVVATFFAPIQYSPAPVLVFRVLTDNSTTLVATGSLISCDPDRIVLKRIVLSGHPFKVNKRSAIIRFMFFNREDIAYFKPCKLRTRLGQTGHIKEPLGTHGHMKCIFNGQIKSQDTIFLNLYKRMFPKYNFEEYKLGINDVDYSPQMEQMPVD